LQQRAVKKKRVELRGGGREELADRLTQEKWASSLPALNSPLLLFFSPLFCNTSNYNIFKGEKYSIDSKK
jgi:hypothetical protein